MSARPAWLTVRGPSAEAAAGIRGMREVLARYRLTTVCQEAVCPNAGECWGRRTATFMILGDVCTRACRFCAVQTGAPGGAIDGEEPERVAAAARELGLAHVVLTSVDRDDLPDGGAAQFAATIRALQRAPGVRVEALVPDFSGDGTAIATLAEAGADVVGHNLETVRRLTPALRDRRAGYDRSLDVLSRFAARGCLTKSSLILGLGETRGEILGALRDLRDVGVSAVCLGQYLRPTARAVS